jgi:tetratricopeptide (TPR) repeat protein
LNHARKAFVFSFLALVSASAIAQAPTAPAKPLAPVYSDALQPWRDFLVKARAADDITDPLQRCLAYPVLPMTQWPAGLVQAHCEYAFGKYPKRKEIFAHIDAGDAKWLEHTFRGFLDRHFSDSDFSEHIHDLFDQFSDDYESGRATQRWLQLAPESPFAMTARANFYRALGWQARGDRYIAETPPEQIAQMESYHAKSAALYQQAIAKEPRMLPAYVGLVQLGKNDDSMGTAAFEAGRKIDPACAVLLSQRMAALLPRWGGSYEQMLALEQQMLPYIEKRPLLALSRVWPYVDLAEGLVRDKKYDEAVVALRPMLAVSSSPDVQEKFFLAYRNTAGADAWSTLTYGVAPKRFRLGEAGVAAYRGYIEYSLPYDYELAARDYANAVELEPGVAGYHYYYGASLERLAKFDEAEREYTLAMKFDPGKGQTYEDALVSQGSVLLQAGHYKRALDVSQRAIAEFPKDAMAWDMHAAALRRNGAPLAQQRDALLKGLKVVDRTSVHARLLETDLQDLDEESRGTK